MKYLWNAYHFTAREDIKSTNWPSSQCMASLLSWSSIALVSRRSRVQIPLKPIFFRLLPSNSLNWKFTMMITPHFLLTKVGYVEDKKIIIMVFIIHFYHNQFKDTLQLFNYFWVTWESTKFIDKCCWCQLWGNMYCLHLGMFMLYTFQQAYFEKFF